MMYSKKPALIATVLLIGFMSISSVPAQAFDRVSDLLNHRFCTSRDCNNLTSEAWRDRDKIEQNARNTINSSLLAWFGLAVEHNITDNEIQEYAINSAYNYARILGASYQEADSISKTIGTMVRREQQKNNPGNCNQFIGAGLKYRTKTLLEELRQGHSRPQPTQSSQAYTDYRPSKKIATENNSCRSCLDEHIPENAQVYLPTKSGSTRSLGDNKVLFDSCGHFLCMNCTQSWFFDNNKDSCPLCRERIDKTVLAHIVESKNDVKTQEALMPENGYNPAPEGMSYQPGAAYPQPSAPPYNE